MDNACFSQIPNIVLQKLDPDVYSSRLRRKVKFVEPETIVIPDESEEVSSSWTKDSVDEQPVNHDTIHTPPDTPAIETCPESQEESPIANHQDQIINTCYAEGSKSDAIVQADFSPILVHRGTQTRESCLKGSISGELNENGLGEGQTRSLCEFKPIFSIPKSRGAPPPLKIGLTLPKGKKRKVFYPDDEVDKYLTDENT